MEIRRARDLCSRYFLDSREAPEEGPMRRSITLCSSLFFAAALGGVAARAAAPLGGEFMVNTYTNGNQVGRSLAVAPNGSFVAIWASEYPGSVFGVRGQRFSSSGAKLGTEFLASTFTTASNS